MKKFLLAAAAVLSMLSIPAFAMDFEEGVHYEVISDEATSEPEIIDFFSVYCGACYQFQPFSRQLASEFPEAYKAYQVDFIAPRDMGEVIVRAWAVAEMLDVASEYKQRIFHEHFVNRNQSNTFEDVKGIFEQMGIAGPQFEQAYGSFAARSLGNRMRSASRDFNIRSTPTFVVNGKYRMIQQGFRDSTNFFNDYMELARFLLNKDQ
ncbi:MULTISPECIES: thiol:disulfide interchange protein DsbA/DsbL [Gammaproteobacteria]|uniref:thiol:disulfide interchange protein DsbA/DsbL n=1 Tax=Gammaproteobacteria TaxID=1236 RepID=UPI000DD0E332|nr:MULTISPECIES: thiol:disulfide interchange protein DsbA/DsbL [Gammaproteobacteria]RTE86762.1 thiol:disulfide interchange protein DsbA/DsbL [Aliidiomarina sp. B3213]TCZ90684.1 thiol:disulfide interchange protein DsbA/DsbL [Lysobacter sp. N42]